MDTIVIEDLEVRYRVGVPEAERAEPQRLCLRVEMETECRAAARSDDLADTIDYYAVTQHLLRWGEKRSWRLIETLAEDIAELVLRDYGARRVRVRVKKFILPEARFVAVEIERPLTRRPV
jgi:dihydroneopterin aldolase